MQKNKFESARKIECLAGSILCSLNSILSVAAALPTILCLLATVICFKDTLPSTYHHPDSFAGPTDIKTAMWFGCSSAILVLYYRFIFINPFYKKEPDSIHVRFKYWWQLALLCSSALFLLIGTFKMFYFTALFEPLGLPIAGLIIIKAVFLFAYSPIILLAISLTGIYYNIKQHGSKNFINKNGNMPTHTEQLLSPIENKTENKSN